MCNLQFNKVTYTERFEFLRESPGDAGTDLDVAVRGLIKTITEADLDDSSRIFHWDGSPGNF